MPRLLLSAIVAVIALCLWSLPAHAQQDITPPTILDLGVEPGYIDTTSTAQTITVTARVTDDISGFDHLTVNFTNGSVPDQTRSVFIHWYHTPFPFEENPRLVRTLEIPRHSAVGTWLVRSVTVYDKADNRESFSNYPEEFADVKFVNSPGLVGNQRLLLPMIQSPP